ncbi:hypothetical protein TEA_030049 [Camellia sinensis var. sinensis]|uniref:Uncharacterized protein n=1 Tax=Camellia sinensis var. sinensis TaxID=542762 RepID=A0A4S4DCP3_CAMSN|nr:hypothetical protein TEA_030049 [Camellia sinensis var. sinensis]
MERQELVLNNNTVNSDQMKGCASNVDCKRGMLRSPFSPFSAVTHVTRSPPSVPPPTSPAFSSEQSSVPPASLIRLFLYFSLFSLSTHTYRLRIKYLNLKSAKGEEYARSHPPPECDLEKWKNLIEGKWNDTNWLDNMIKIQAEHCFQPSVVPTTPEELSVKLLKPRSGYVKGLGLRPSFSVRTTSASTDIDYVRHLQMEIQEQNEEIQSQKEEITTQKHEIQAQKEEIQAQNNVIGKMNESIVEHLDMTSSIMEFLKKQGFKGQFRG